MGHNIRDKKTLKNRVRRIRGRIEAIERTLLEEGDCISVLQQITSCRGAIDGLLEIVPEDHIQTHLVDAPAHNGEHGDGKEQLVEIVHSFQVSFSMSEFYEFPFMAGHDHVLLGKGRRRRLDAVVGRRAGAVVQHPPAAVVNDNAEPSRLMHEFAEIACANSSCGYVKPAQAWSRLSLR